MRRWTRSHADALAGDSTGEAIAARNAPQSGMGVIRARLSVATGILSTEDDPCRRGEDRGRGGAQRRHRGFAYLPGADLQAIRLALIRLVGAAVAVAGRCQD